MPTARARRRIAPRVGVKALSPDVLQVELENPAPHFLKLLTHISFLPLHPSLLRTTGWENANTVIGNGPFVMRSRSDTEILLDKNPHYWDAGNVALDKLRVRFMDDAERRHGRVHHGQDPVGHAVSHQLGQAASPPTGSKCSPCSAPRTSSSPAIRPHGATGGSAAASPSWCRGTRCAPRMTSSFPPSC